VPPFIGEHIMKISLDQTCGILNRSIDEVLYIANNEKRLPISLTQDEEILYNEDGTITFNENVETKEPQWFFLLEDVLAFKKEMDEGLVGKVESHLND
jgi:hypothetical protein